MREQPAVIAWDLLRPPQHRVHQLHQRSACLRSPRHAGTVCGSPAYGPVRTLHDRACLLVVHTALGLGPHDHANQVCSFACSMSGIRCVRHSTYLRAFSCWHLVLARRAHVATGANGEAIPSQAFCPPMLCLLLQPKMMETTELSRRSVLAWSCACKPYITSY